jgi:hypothetical protein
MSKKKSPEPEEPVSFDDRLMQALSDLLPDEGPIMITSWVAFLEYVTEDGSPQLAAFASPMPPWRMTGMIEAGAELLIQEFEYEDFDD